MAKVTNLHIYKREALRRLRDGNEASAHAAFLDYRAAGGALSFAQLRSIAKNKAAKLARALRH